MNLKKNTLKVILAYSYDEVEIALSRNCPCLLFKVLVIMYIISKKDKFVWTAISSKNHPTSRHVCALKKQLFVSKTI